MTTSPSAIRAYFDAYGKGFARKDAARIAGVSVRTAQNIEKRYGRRGSEPIPVEPAGVVESETCCSEGGCRRQHPVLIRREGSNWYAVTKYVHRLDGSLSISERHDITEQMRELVKT